MEVPMKKLDKLAAYIDAVANKEATIETYKQYEQDILNVNARELFELFYARLLKNEKQQDILLYLDKLMHVFYQSLKHKKVSYPEDSFLDHLHQENNQLSIRLESIKEILKENELSDNKQSLLERFTQLRAFDVHYIKKENILFPYLEKKSEIFQGVSIMWSLHDQTRNSLNEVIDALSIEPLVIGNLEKAIGRYFFDAYGLIQKEESILFVVTMQECSLNELEHMREQSFDFGFAFIDTPSYRKVDVLNDESNQWLYSTKTGTLTYKQLTLFLDTLPIDCTIVDENDKVVYFNSPKDRFFPRSPAVIGRDVSNCHPAESVSVVHRILDAFKANDKDTASFWIDFKGRKLLIQYYAMRDENNAYKGVIEVTQDISDIVTIKGQKRLLDWE